jgi:hypothetical protein
MCTSRLRIRGTDVHQQAKEKRDRYAPVGQAKEGQMCASSKGGEGQMCTSRLRIREMDVHQQAKNKRDNCAPAS